MLNRIKNLSVTPEKDYYKLTATIETEQGDAVLSSKIAQPYLKVNISSDTSGKHFKHFILNKTVSFHFNANALCDVKDNTLFTLTLDKKEKSFIPKKHRKREKKSSKR